MFPVGGRRRCLPQPAGQRDMTRVLRRILSGSWGTAQWPPARMRLNLSELEGRPLVKAEGSEAATRGESGADPTLLDAPGPVGDRVFTVRTGAT